MGLSVASRWVAAVYAVHHLTSDPPGPRFKGRDATLLHRLLRPLVAGEPAQAGVPSGKGVGVLPARSVVHPKTEVRVSSLSVVGQHMAPGVFQGLVLELGAGELAWTVRTPQIGRAHV